MAYIRFRDHFKGIVQPFGLHEQRQGNHIWEKDRLQDINAQSKDQTDQNIILIKVRKKSQI